MIMITSNAFRTRSLLLAMRIIFSLLFSHLYVSLSTLLYNEGTSYDLMVIQCRMCLLMSGASLVIVLC